MQTIAAISTKEQEILTALETVMDPEIPTLSVINMGMITGVSIGDNDYVLVKMIPTFMACPAIHVIKKSIKDKVESLGYSNVGVLIDDSIIWNSDRITPKGKQLLETFRLGTPNKHEGSFDINEISHSKCPHCGSTNTTMNSMFGSTLCRSIHFCFDCKQGFERFKPL